MTSNQNFSTENSKKIIYLTFNDSPSGIYKSQVIDRVYYLNEIGHSIQLISFLPSLNFQKNKQLILNWIPSAIVLQQLPGLKYWWSNLLLLLPYVIRSRPKKIIGRSIYATNLGLILKKLGSVKQVIYDGRGAVTAECDEFKMVPKNWLFQIKRLEFKGINQSDQQLSVSQALVDYWKKEFSYMKSTFTVIPCTLGKQFENIEISEETIKNARRKIGFESNDIVIAYSGSLAGWQFKEGLEVALSEWLGLNQNHKLLFLCKPSKKIDFIKGQHPTQVIQHFVKPEEVPSYLISADYGLLVRENLVTNKVASPVKFAEYLACGLGLIISPNIGDYSKLVQEKNIGFVWNKGSLFLERVLIDSKLFNQEFSAMLFSLTQYDKVFK